MEEEIWKELEENPNYFISNFGNFKNKKDKLLNRFKSWYNTKIKIVVHYGD